MEYEYEFKTALWIVFFLALIILPISLITKSTGMLVINRDYQDKYLETKQELDKLKEAREIQCQPVECKQGASGYVFIFFGFIVYVTSLWLYWSRDKKLDMRESELKEKEKELAQKSTLLLQSAKKPRAK